MAEITILKEHLPWSESDKRYSIEELGVLLMLALQRNRVGKCLITAGVFLRKLGYKNPNKEDIDHIDQIIGKLCNRNCVDDYIIVSRVGPESHIDKRLPMNICVVYNHYDAKGAYCVITEDDIEALSLASMKSRHNFYAFLAVYLVIMEHTEKECYMDQFGNVCKGHIGFVSKKFIGNTIGVSENTVHGYLSIMETEKIIGVAHSGEYKNVNSYAIPSTEYLIEASAKRTARVFGGMLHKDTNTERVKYSYRKKKYGGVC